MAKKKKVKTTKEKQIDERAVKAKERSFHYDKLDNTAHLFPVIANEGMTNVYRVAITLKEEVDGKLLQDALDVVLPYFDVFCVRMRKGVFWHYFETNRKVAPPVLEENGYPCRFINPYENNDYLFRVSYYKRRINLEVFHVLTDGNGALAFLKELTYQYLRYRYPGDFKDDTLAASTSLDYDDSYMRNSKENPGKIYKTEKAVIVKGPRLSGDKLGVIAGHIALDQLKAKAKSYGITINQFLVGSFVWSVYQAYLGGRSSKQPISVCVPVNLRPYFDSTTTKNFFVIVSATFKPVEETYTFEEVLKAVADSLKEQITKENLEKLLSYNVSNETNPILRILPLSIKGIGLRIVYKTSARANTTTITNLGLIQVEKDYEDYIEGFQAVLSMSQGQNIKGAVCAYKNRLTFTFSSHLKDTSIQKTFFAMLGKNDIDVTIETNGVYNG